MKNLRYDGIEEDTDSENYKHHYVELVDEDGNPMEYYSSIGKCNYGEIGDIIWVRERLVYIHTRYPIFCNRFFLFERISFQKISSLVLFTEYLDYHFLE
jgi:hypothetical protein